LEAEITMESITTTQARKELFQIIDRAVQGHEIVRIRHREGEAVILSGEDYENLVETLELLSAPGFSEGLKEAEADIAAGRTVSLEEALGGA